ncbi:hypothetical protein WT56_20715 [Burkholderia pseudomultivorans]|uniref:Uncharacterized protein n=1 Tax=Burkholderia pseudomultivorans TaxID=1207504 RepID=A0A132EDH8_9BURK|nr:hypothetical protein WT56_20715 [Burkholderia pseudomultivorans]
MTEANDRDAGSHAAGRRHERAILVHRPHPFSASARETVHARRIVHCIIACAPCAAHQRFPSLAS